MNNPLHIWSSLLALLVGVPKKDSDIPEIFEQTQMLTHLNVQKKGITIEHENWSDWCAHKHCSAVLMQFYSDPFTLPTITV